MPSFPALARNLKAKTASDVRQIWKVLSMTDTALTLHFGIIFHDICSVQAYPYRSKHGATTECVGQRALRAVDFEDDHPAFALNAERKINSKMTTK